MRLVFLRLTIVLCLIPFMSSGQTRSLDSLSRQLELHPDNSTRETFYYEKALHFLMNGQPDSLKYYSGRLKELGEQDYPAAMASFYHLRVYQLVQKEQFDSAIRVAHQELWWAKKSNDALKIGNAYNALGNTFIYLGDGDSSIIYLHRGLPFAEKSGHFRLPVNMLYNLSAAYNIIEDYPAAREHAKKAFERAERTRDERSLRSALFNWATMEAKLGNRDTALIMFSRIMSIAKSENNDLLLMDVLNNMGELYYDKKDFRNSLAQYEQVARILKNHQNPADNFYLHANRGHTLAALGRFQQAKDDLGKALQLASQLNDKSMLVTVYSFQAELAEKSNDYKNALAYWKVADSVRQLTVTETSRQHLQQLEVKYQTAQKDLAISQQQLELANRENDIRKKTTQNILLLAGCILLIIILVLAYRNIRHRQKLASQERELYKQKIEEMEKKHQIDAMQSILMAQEEERGRLAKDLHDGIGGLLSGVKLGLSAMRNAHSLLPQNANKLDHVVAQLDRSISELRRVSHNMMPEALLKYGLQEALENYCEGINRSGQLKIKLQTYGLAERMGQDEEISLYRIVQELLNNIIKHSGATNVLIQLTHENKRFSLTVEDNGKGFDMENVNVRNSVGIVNIKSRAQFLNGSVDFQTAPGEGTSVTIIGQCRA